jgi:pimeloyl-ACP methyl ester carboxylesterase
MKRKIFLIGGIVLLVLMVLFIFGWIKTGELLAAPKRQNNFTPKELGLNYEEAEIEVSGSKVKLWYIDAKSETTIIFIPGWGGNRADFLENGRDLILALFNSGLNLCFFDPRGLGESDGKLFAFGYFEAEDTEKVMDWLKERGKTKFILFGVSAGANCAIRVATKREEVVATVADSPFYNLMNTEIYPRFLLHFFRILASLRLGFDLVDKLDLSNYQLSNIKNILLIAGEKDKVCPPKEAKFVFEKVKEPKFFWIANVAHCEAALKYPKEYKEKLLSFLSSLGLLRPFFYFSFLIKLKRENAK